ncbi:integrin alpha, partial [Myxococcota bacterium]|nr:integrin alpha [Myxococcota bacterium]
MMTLGILLFSCSTPPIAEEARIAPAMSEDWLSTVRGRIAAQARAFSPDGLGYRAGAGAFGLSALVTDEGLSFAGEADAAPSMGLRLGAWGREGALGPAGDAAPTLGACVAERAPSGDCVRRVERPLAGLTEWWVGLDNGVEQGFVLDVAPPGEGPVVFEIEVSNAAQVESSRLIDLDGRSWSVGDLAAWDADGTRLAVWMTAAGDTLRLVVDDSGARYPIEVDPSYTTSGWSVVDGSYFGLEVTEAGDVNGDGLGDVAVASFRAGGVAGSAWVFYGSATAPYLPTRPSVTLRSNGLGSHFGADIASAGDVNGDGLSDLIVGEIAASA